MMKEAVLVSFRKGIEVKKGSLVRAACAEESRAGCEGCVICERTILSAEKEGCGWHE